MGFVSRPMRPVFRASVFRSCLTAFASYRVTLASTLSREERIEDTLTIADRRVGELALKVDSALLRGASTLHARRVEFDKEYTVNWRRNTASGS